MRRSLYLFIACCLALTGLAAAAAAKDEQAKAEKLVCFALPKNATSARAAALINQRLRASCQQASRHVYVNPRDKLLAGEPDPRLNHLAKAARYAAEAQDFVDNMEMEAGIASYIKAREMLQKAAGRLGDGQQYIQTMLQLGAAYILQANPDLGQAFFQEAAMFAPDTKPDPTRYTPAMIEVFERAQVFAKGQPLCSGMVKSVPDAAEIYMNADFRGITPMTLKDVPEGEQFLRVEKDGWMHWGQFAAFWATHEEVFSAELKKTSLLGTLKEKTKDIFKDMDESPPPFPIVKLAEWYEAKHMVLMQVEQEGNDIRVKFLLIQTNPRKKLHLSSRSFKLDPDRLLTLNSLTFREAVDAYLKDMRKKLLD